MNIGEIVMTGHLTLSGAARWLLFGTAVLLTATTAALAQTTRLVCHYNVSFVIEDEATTVEMDEARNTIAVHFGAMHYAPTMVASVSTGASIGPMPAVFGDDTITFSNAEPAYTGDFVIDRTTGAMVNTTINWRWACQAGRKQF